MDGKEIYNFIKPHLGNIHPTGHRNTDMDNIKNFKKYQELINCLLEDLDSTFYYSKNSYGAYEDSVKAINNKAKEVMIETYKWLDDYQDEFK